MARDWNTLRELAIRACGGTPRAVDEAWSHLSEAHRLLASQLDVPELAAIATSVTLPANNESVAISTISSTVYAILDIYNVTDGIPMYPEPAGATGRRSFLTNTGLPYAGVPTHYVHDGTTLYVRGLPTQDTQLRVRYQRQMPDLSGADGSSAPITPQQYDRALVHKAAELYFLLHPNENLLRDGDRTTQQSDKHGAAFDKLVGDPNSVRVEENMARVGRFRLSGFRMAPSSRRRR